VCVLMSYQYKISHIILHRWQTELAHATRQTYNCMFNVSLYHLYAAKWQKHERRKAERKELAITSSLCASRQRTVNITLHDETAKVHTSTKT